MLKSRVLAGVLAVAVLAVPFGPEATAACDDICSWNTVIAEIVARDGVTPEQATANLLNLLVPAERVAPPRYIHPNIYVDQWYGHVIDAGWPAELWPWVSCVINRESGGNPGAWKRSDPAGSRHGSRGLMQMNSVNLGFLRQAGILWSVEELFNPWTNLRAGWELYKASGRGPWAAQRKRC